MFRRFVKPSFLFCTALLSVILFNGCAAESSVAAPESAAVTQFQPEPKGATIDIQPNSPADTVRAFYQRLREKRFREAIFLTNLRPAIEGLTDTELREFQVDLESIASSVPAELQINGEIISGETATVTANIPDDETGKPAVQQIRLRQQNGVWVILTVDEAAEQIIKKEGKNYFYQLRIETHEDEARSMLERISKAQIASLATKGAFADIQTLVDAKFLPADIRSSESTGYNYAIKIADDKKRYSATATPAEYGKSGRLSFVFDSDGRHIPKIVSKDNGGQPLKQ
ncbi:MAG: hypothetical protein ABI791_00960 [Acidobacteriota bacterium]